MLTSKDEDEILPFSEFMMLREEAVDGQLSWRTGHLLLSLFDMVVGGNVRLSLFDMVVGGHSLLSL